mmetsp:Transcript_14460/g.59003  ORF Transcript_14460/g.59003 Transcript_14460/m.59003 type:complete len:216 (+) Transcript_14460:1396-2043(+)
MNISLPTDVEISRSTSRSWHSWWGWEGGHNAHARGHMGATRRRTYAATEPATAATGSEARPSQASPSAAAARGDGASPMGTAGAPMVNEGAPMVDDTGDEDDESSDEEDEVVMDTARKLECGSARKNHARVQVTLPVGTQPNVVHINTFCCNEKSKLWGEIVYTEVAALPHTATNRFKITDDLVKPYAKLAARANDLGVNCRSVTYFCQIPIRLT